MKKLLHYIKFLLTATNQHGVHSPFIYSYVTKCIYAKSNYAHSKSVTVFLKSIDYFEVKNAWLPCHEKKLKNLVQNEFSKVRFENEPYDIIFADPPEAKKLMDEKSSEKKIHNDTLLLIADIYGNSLNRSIWKNLKSNQKIKVSVDMFYCVAVFFRKEQVSEHFKIRL